VCFISRCVAVCAICCSICGHEMEYHNYRYILHVSSRIEQWSRRNEPCSNKNKSCPRGFPAIGDNVLVPVSRRIESWSHRNESWSHRNEPCSNKNKSCPRGFPQKVMFYLFMCHVGLSHGHAGMSHVQTRINHVQETFPAKSEIPFPNYMYVVHVSHMNES